MIIYLHLKYIAGLTTKSKEGIKMDFKKVNTLYGHTNIEELENDEGVSIFYADGVKESVINAVNQEPHFKDRLAYHELNGWFIAVFK